MVTLEWGDFGGKESESKYLDEVEVSWEHVSSAYAHQGTTLTLDGLQKENWTENDFEKLHARLTRLVSPFQEVADFGIFLEIPGYSQFSGEAQPPQLILRPKYVLRGKLDDVGLFTGVIQYEGKTRKLIHIKMLK